MFSTLKLIGAASLILVPAIAMAKPDVTLTLARYGEKLIVSADGTTKSEIVPASPDMKVTPGDPVIYVMTYANNGDEPANNAVIADDIPASIEFSGTDDTNSSVSVDGGKTWGQLNELTVPVPGTDPRAAGPADVTHIRWVVSEIAPGSTGKVSYRARLK